MAVFYWTMGSLTLLTMAPSVFFFVLFLATGEPGCERRAKALFQWSRLFALLGVNLGIWGHVAVAAWRIFWP